MKGTQTYEWLSRLAPHLTGERTLDELVDPLPAEQRAMVEGLVETLSEQQFVVDAMADEPHILDTEEQRVYTAEIAFIRYRLDSAERRFQRVREARIALVGEGPVVEALLAAGLWSGWRDVRVLTPAAQVAALQQVVVGTWRDPKQSVRLQAWPERDGADGRQWQVDVAGEADVVLQVCGEAHRTELIAVSRVCAAAGTALGQVLVGDNEAWATPVGPPEGIEAESCWRRLAAQRDTDVETVPDGGWLTGPVPGIVAAQVALSCFAHLTGLDTLPPPERAPQPPVLTRIDLRTLVTRTHRVRPHPLAGPQAPGTEADTRALIDELAHGAPVPAAELLERAAGFVDTRTGLLGVLDEEELSQIPLSVCRASVSDPYGALPTWAPAPIVMGWGKDRPTARLRTLLAALATYGTLSTGPTTGHQWGLDLVTGALRTIPATAAYPVLGGASLPYRAPVGAAAGRCWNDAIAAGLRAHCEALLAQHRNAGGRGTQLDATEVVSQRADEQAMHLLRLLHAADQHLSVTDLSDILGLPAFALRTDADAGSLVLTCATTVAEALYDGLERIVLGWQARTEDLPSFQTSAGQWPVEMEEPHAGDPSADPRCRLLIGTLQRAGQVPVAVPMIQDRQARSLLPYVVQVVLCSQGGPLQSGGAV